MKKYFIVLGLVLVPFAAKASLMRFPNDRGVWDESGKQLYTCWENGQSCVGLDNKVYTLAELGLEPIIPLPAVGLSIPVSTPQTTYVPIYTPTPQFNDQPLGISWPGFDASTPAPTPTPTPVVEPVVKIQDHSISSNVPIYIKSFKFNLKNKGNKQKLEIRTTENWDGPVQQFVYKGVLPVDYNQDGEYIYQKPFFVDSYGSLVFQTDDIDLATGQSYDEHSYIPYSLTLIGITYQVKGESVDRTFTVPLP